MALYASNTRSYTETERARFEDRHWREFNRWLADVARYRGLSFEEAEALAGGRVWTGRQAVANGLADELGGLDRAVEVAKDLAGIDPDDQVTLMHLPERKELLDLLLSGGDGNELAADQVLTTELRHSVAQTHQLVTHGSWLMAPSFDVR
jgi:protease-4